MASTKKRDIVDQLLELLQQNHFALVHFEQTTHQQLEELRNALLESSTQFKVIKNSLFEKAVHKLSQTDKDFTSISKSHFPIVEKSALLILADDYMEGLKKFYEASKTNETLTFKVGRVDSHVYGSAQLTKLAQLPGKEELMAKIIGSMKSPMVRTTRSMRSGAQKFVFILQQASQKEQ